MHSIQRRQLLTTCAFLGALPAFVPRRRVTALRWEEFLERAPGEVAELAKGTTPAEHDAYLYRLASLAALVERVPGGTLSPFAKLDPEVLFGLLHRGQPFFVVEWRLTPNAVLPAHCHPGASVCTVALEGECEIRHYEPEPDAPSYASKAEEPFALRETRRQRLRAGSVSTLSPSRDNLHFFRAGAQGARGIDISTMHGGDGSFSFVAFDPERPLEEGVHEARWVGKEPR